MTLILHSHSPGMYLLVDLQYFKEIYKNGYWLIVKWLMVNCEMVNG